MKIYLSGPMTGLPEFNYPAFRKAAAALREAGHFVHNPAEFDHDGPLDGRIEEFPIREAMAEFCEFICKEADAVVLLDGWESSDGAQVEAMLAKRIGVELIPWRAVRRKLVQEIAGISPKGRAA